MNPFTVGIGLICSNPHSICQIIFTSDKNGVSSLTKTRFIGQLIAP